MWLRILTRTITQGDKTEVCDFCRLQTHSMNKMFGDSFVYTPVRIILSLSHLWLREQLRGNDISPINFVLLWYEIGLPLWVTVPIKKKKTCHIKIT